MIKKAILSPWNFMRVLRLLAGLAILVQAIIQRDIFFGMAGILFSGMALFNTGCCSTAGCYSAPGKSDKNLNEVSYEEVA